MRSLGPDPLTLYSVSMQKAALITGAGSGIGRALAQRLAGEGYALVLAGRTESALDETARALGGAEYHIHPADVADPRQCDDLVAAAALRFNRIDLLAHVAGYAALATIPDTDLDTWRRTFDVNATAAWALTRAAWPIFTRQKSGLIVNVSSMASIDPFPGFAAYASAKAAVNMFTLVTAREGEAIGLRAVAIAPGAVETPMLRSMFDESMIPRGAAMDPDTVAQIIADCAAGRRAFESGGVIRIVP